MRRTSLVDRLPPLASALPATSERTEALLAAASNLYGYCPVDAPITAATPFGRDYPKLRDSPCGYLGRCPCRASGWPDPHDRDPLQRLYRGELQDSVRYTTTTRICATSGGLRGSRKRDHLPHSPTGTSAHQLPLLRTVVRSRRHVRSRAGLQCLVRTTVKIDLIPPDPAQRLACKPSRKERTKSSCTMGIRSGGPN